MSIAPSATNLVEAGKGALTLERERRCDGVWGHFVRRRNVPLTLLSCEREEQVGPEQNSRKDVCDCLPPAPVSARQFGQAALTACPFACVQLFFTFGLFFICLPLLLSHLQCLFLLFIIILCMCSCSFILPLLFFSLVFDA